MRKLEINPENWKFWLIVAFLLKFVVFIFFILFFSTKPDDIINIKGFIGYISNDTSSYIQPIENLIHHKDFSFLFQYRMFGYGLPYYLLRFVFESGTSLNIIIFIQYIFASISLYLLALFAFRIVNRFKIFIITFLGYFLFPIISFYDIAALTESFTSSFMLISVFLLVYKRTTFNIVIIGILLTWMAFLRPVCFPLFLLFFLYFIIKDYKKGILHLIRYSILFFLPLILFEGVWIAGNYHYKNKINLTTPTIFHPVYLNEKMHSMDMIHFLQSIGEEWENNVWFYSNTKNCPYDKNIFTSKFNKDTLINMKKDILIAQDGLTSFNNAISDSIRIAKNIQIKKKLKEYTNSVKMEKKIIYYFYSPLKFLSRLIFSSSTYRMFGEYNTTNKWLLVFRYFVDFCFWVTQILSFLFIIILIINHNLNAPFLLISLILIYFYFIHAIIFKSNDFRYLIPIITFEILYSFCLINMLKQKIFIEIFKKRNILHINSN